MPHDDGKVVRLFYGEADLEEAWRVFDEAMLHQRALYNDPESTELDRLQATLAAKEAEDEFRRIYERVTSAKLLRA